MLAGPIVIVPILQARFETAQSGHEECSRPRQYRRHHDPKGASFKTVIVPDVDFAYQVLMHGSSAMLRGRVSAPPRPPFTPPVACVLWPVFSAKLPPPV